MIELQKLRFVVVLWGDCYWSASFHDFYSFLVRHAEKSAFDMDSEPGFKELKTRPKWLTKPFGTGLESSRYDLPFGGFIEPLDWGPEEFEEAAHTLADWHATVSKVPVDG